MKQKVINFVELRTSGDNNCNNIVKCYSPSLLVISGAYRRPSVNSGPDSDNGIRSVPLRTQYSCSYYD